MTGSRMLEIPTFEELKRYVKMVLCSRAGADSLAPLLEATLIRKGKACGIEYTLLPAKSVRLSAIWDTFDNRVLFYDQDLQRFMVTTVRGPDPATLDGRPVDAIATRSVWNGK